MPFTMKDLLYGGLSPVVVAFVFLLLMRRMFPDQLRRRHAAPLAIFVAFFVGYWLLALAPMVPTAHWHWLPSLMLFSVVIGAAACADGILVVERPVLYLSVAWVSGWLLVPTWDDLDPSRAFHLGAYTLYVVVLASCLEPLFERRVGPLMPAVLWLTMTAAAIVLALSGSLRFAQIAMAGASAIFGVMLVGCVSRTDNVLRGSAILFAVMAVGSMLVGRVNSFSEVPLAAYVLVPAAPAFIWCGEVGPLSKLEGVKRILACVSVPLIILGVAVALAVFAEMSTGSEY